MTVEEQIKQAADEYNNVIFDKLHGQDSLDMSHVHNAFIAGANFGRELGMKEAFEWIPSENRLPDIKPKTYMVLVTNKPDDSFGTHSVPIHDRDSIRHIEVAWEYWRPINQEDMP